MPQGKVIAIKPAGSKSVEYAFRSATPIDDIEDYEFKRLIFIGQEKDNHKIFSSKKLKSIFWFEDDKDQFHLDDLVEFKSDPSNKLSINGAKEVKKKGHPIVDVSDGLLTKVAILASVLLLVAVVTDGKR